MLLCMPWAHQMELDAAAAALDAGQYTLDEIRKYEAVYGQNFVSPGGAGTARQIFSLLQWAPGMQVLDVGCGLGGAALLLAQLYGAKVHGIDLSRNMLAQAAVRSAQAGLAHAVSWEHADILEYQPQQPSDVVHSRDVFLHIHRKPQLLAALMRCLRPGGSLLFSDYLCGPAPHSAEFTDYIRSRNYHLCTLAGYCALLQSAGFEVLVAEDRTAAFVEILERELAGMQSAALSETERRALAHSWQRKIERAQAGEQRWGVFCARRAPG